MIAELLARGLSAFLKKQSRLINKQLQVELQGLFEGVKGLLVLKKYKKAVLYQSLAQ